MEVMTVKMNREFWRFTCSTPGLILIAVVLVLVSLTLDKVFGASYFTMVSIVTCFLVLLIIFLCVQLFEAKLIKKIRKSITENDDEGGQ